jgi:CRISPR-associated protein Csm1
MDDRQAVIMAALLHDLGKFAQRAGQRLTSEDRAVESFCCPSFKGRYSHTHVLHAGKWIRKVLGERFDLVEILALFHHFPQACTSSRLAKLVTLADRLSSGERESLPEEETPGRVAEIPLTCLFTKLMGTEGLVEELPMRPLEPDLTAWFKPGPHPTNYAALWDAFNLEVGRLDKNADINLLIEQLLALLQKFTLYMPAAAYRERPDISLFHHLKASAALAACLYYLELEENLLYEFLAALRGSAKALARLDREDFLLTAADMSGIQDFIYSVTSAHALRGLKGRSLYLELLGQVVASQVLAELRLPHANLIFQGGGNFFLLLPNTELAKGTLRKWRHLTNEALVQAHGGQLALAVYQQPVTYNNFFRPPPDEKTSKATGFADIWEKAAAGLAREKRRKFVSYWEDIHSIVAILGPHHVSGEEPVCPVCSEEAAGAPEEACALCESFADLARGVASAHFLELQLAQPKSAEFKFSSYTDAFAALGAKVRFLRRDGPIHPEMTFILNDTDLFTPWGACRGFTFMAHHVPREADGTVKTLEELASAASGIRKWGLLRADVDNLGQVFTVGLGADDRTLSRLSTLSTLLSLFFSGHVQSLVQKSYADSVYLVYAGGDDLCLLAPWSVLPDLVMKLREDFSHWTRGRLTLSGGIYLAPRDKFPVFRAAGGAGDLLAQAKQQDKNRLGIFEQAVIWDDLELLAQVKDKLVVLLEEHQVPKALFSMLRASWLEREQHAEGKLPTYRVWRLLYGLRRLAERLSRDKKLAALPVLQDLEQTLIVNHYLRPHTDIAVRWAEYLMREGG